MFNMFARGRSSAGEKSKNVGVNQSFFSANIWGINTKNYQGNASSRGTTLVNLECQILIFWQYWSMVKPFNFENGKRSEPLWPSARTRHCFNATPCSGLLENKKTHVPDISSTLDFKKVFTWKVCLSWAQGRKYVDWCSDTFCCKVGRNVINLNDINVIIRDGW